MRQQHGVRLDEAKAYVMSHDRDKDERAPEWILDIRKQILSGAGGVGWRDVNTQALAHIDTWLVKALELRYNMADDNIRKAFSSFCLMVQTQGWVGKDTGGTTTGNNTHGKTAMGAGFDGSMKKPL